ncbi:uncharacterized protein LY79DRAFT_585319 [Colletotrichum navitas]|uniref:Uncharacterized protein n=1 Tax=Colletotrichum navitas TaxID=681940 RepID=A0AAD8UUW2_9PEZI|nr:uncharacterized protein LY79DRAFT_585319 [Colletotrichum navitas]KAK1564098.1 hypothetical protein LY79DRAFT_585319 [Colletotrichum navitas]
MTLCSSARIPALVWALLGTRRIGEDLVRRLRSKSSIVIEGISYIIIRIRSTPYKSRDLGEISRSIKDNKDNRLKGSKLIFSLKVYPLYIYKMLRLKASNIPSLL